MPYVPRRRGAYRLVHTVARGNIIPLPGATIQDSRAGGTFAHAFLGVHAMAGESSTSPSSGSTPSRAAWWGDRGVKTKILSAVTVAGVVAGAVGVLGISSLSDSAAAADAMYSDNLLGVAAAGDMDTALSDMRIGSRAVLLAADAAGRQQNLASLQGQFDAFDAAVDAYVGTGVDAERRAILDPVITAKDSYETWQLQVMAPIALRGDLVGWVAENAATGKPLTDAMSQGAQA